MSKCIIDKNQLHKLFGSWPNKMGNKQLYDESAIHNNHLFISYIILITLACIIQITFQKIKINRYIRWIPEPWYE
ncbi:hypothetical protein DERP_007593 [Dermatophagoides pteronyssinus]|uniref:Uncharacterized protein n=1 Tax=Dermatophagoides pteronyssinus TaxID=6956 RepID=A0ABQ8JKM7_DERPT|nr:hypothetical protein DERP_007593 [Dermatophagoides pteronyssinus]